MKQLVVIVACMMLLKPAMPFFNYIVNYDYVSKVLCENKDKPKMHCNGKCHLMKELAKDSESEKPISSGKKGATQEMEVLFFEVIQTVNFKSFCSNLKRDLSTPYSNLYNYLKSNTVFHPPAHTA